MSRFSELDREEHQGRIAQWERHGLAAIKADLNSGGTGLVGTREKQRIAWLWVEREEQRGREREEAAAAQKKKEENSFSAVLERTFKEKAANYFLLVFVCIVLVCGGIFLGAAFGIEYFKTAFQTLKAIISVW